MEKGYFAAAWGDVTRSPGWISKLMRLGLLTLVPVFGGIVLYGYLYAWARDIAWNVHRPLPERIFGNEDGNLYKRGFFIFVIAVVFSLVPMVFNGLASVFSGVSVVGIGLGSFASLDGVASSAGGGLFVGFLLNVVAFALSLAVTFFVWVGSMRCAVYGTLSSGFQLGKIWTMLRYDFAGLLRIFGMVLLCGLVIGVIVFVCVFLVVFVGAFAAFAFAATDLPGALAAIGVLLLIAVAVVAACFVNALVEALTARALGYWTRQFEVHLWGGQEDPLPFEQRAATAQATQAQDPAAHQQGYPYGQASGPYAQGQWQQPAQPQQQAGWGQQAYSAVPGQQPYGATPGQQQPCAAEPVQQPASWQSQPQPQQPVAGVWPAGAVAPQPVAAPTATQPATAPVEAPAGGSAMPGEVPSDPATAPQPDSASTEVQASASAAAEPAVVDSAAVPQPAAEPPVIDESAPQPARATDPVAVDPVPAAESSDVPDDEPSASEETDDASKR